MDNTGKRCTGLIFALLGAFGVGLFFWAKPDPDDHSPTALRPSVFLPRTDRSVATSDSVPSPAPNSASRRAFFDAITIQDRDPARAEKLLGEALAADPTFESALERIARIHIELQRLDLAQDEASRCLGVNPRNLSCHHTLIDALGPHSENAVQDCLAVHPDNYYCLEKARGFYLERGEGARFENMLQTAFRSEYRDDDGEAVLKAGFYERIGDLANARQVYSWACEQGRSEACEARETLDRRAQ